MEKKYQVFISSTFKDLARERQEVIQALLELDCIPVGMELFPAADEDQWSLIKRLIEDCDYYVLIVGGRYGSLNSNGISYTQLEYDYALSIGIPIISFLHKDPEKIEAGKSEKDPVLAEKLNAFRHHVQEKMCRYWESPQDLGSQVSRSLVRLIKDKPRIGWVKANMVAGEDLTREVLELRRQNDELKEQLRMIDDNAPSGSELLSQAEDPISFECQYYAVVNKTDWHYSSRQILQEGILSTTWNEIFARIAPLMVDEASETSLKENLDEFCQVKLTNELRQHSSQFIEFGKFRIRTDDFQKIKVQFRALGYIKMSNKKRSIKETDTYWQLTPYGDTAMTRLVAIKRQVSLESTTVGPGESPA